MYIIPGTSGHANIYKNARGEKLEHFKKDLMERLMPKEVDFGASIFPKGMSNSFFEVSKVVNQPRCSQYP
jgi:hypothetical protein